MARARRKASSPAPAATVVPEQEEEPETSEQSLKFNQSLIGRPGRPIALAELLKRLKTLHAELANIDQDDCPREAITNIARELADSSILGHRDNGVKAWTACCLVEVFRVMAPDAPFTPTQLKVSRDLMLDACASL